MANTAKKVTLEDAWEIVKELGAAQKETDCQLKETDRQLKESSFELKEAQKETDRQLKETDRQLKETDRQLKESSFELKEAVKQTMRSVDKTNGNFNNKWGSFLENLVEGDLVNLLNKRGIQVVKINSRVKYLRSDNSVGAEYDLIAINGSEIVVFEIKTTLSTEKVKSFVEKLIKFKGLFPEYSNKKIYGGIAYMRADGNSDEEAIEEGLFLIKAPGGAVNVSTLVNSDEFTPKAF